MIKCIFEVAGFIGSKPYIAVNGADAQDAYEHFRAAVAKSLVETTLSYVRRDARHSSVTLTTAWKINKISEITGLSEFKIKNVLKGIARQDTVDLVIARERQLEAYICGIKGIEQC